jgi:cysteinyl-tRNA synthetase
MYVCGPTVYNYAHIGNARPVVVFDCLYRLLSARYSNVVYARNITDIDDKIIQAAAGAKLRYRRGLTRVHDRLSRGHGAAQCPFSFDRADGH